jgi:hypothetical protein
MKANDLIQARLVNQGLAAAKFETCADVVAHFGAIQSQDYAMARWAVGMRMRKASDSEVEQCVNSGQIIRTHILRPTWHFVNKQDIRWMMELTAPNIKKATQYVDKQVGLTDAVYKKLWKIIAVELTHEDNLTKEDILERLGKKKIKVESLLLTQLLIRAEVDMRVCSGIRKGKAGYLFPLRQPDFESSSNIQKRLPGKTRLHLFPFPGTGHRKRFYVVEWPEPG